ncbi:MAG: trypsin-like serine protease [Pseudomonadota bacterium]
MAQSANERFRPSGLSALGMVVAATQPQDNICTGTLIGTDRVLTAAHCLVDQEVGGWVSPSDTVFFAGQSAHDYTLQRRVRRILVHPDFDPDLWSDATDAPFDDLVPQIHADVAVLELARPVRKARVAPVDVSQTAAFAGPVAVFGYGHVDTDALKPYPGCLLFYRDATSVSLSCRVEPGVSGAPMVGELDGAWQIFGVVSVIRYGTFVGTMGPRVTSARLSELRDIRQKETTPFNSAKRSGKTAPKK